MPPRLRPFDPATATAAELAEIGFVAPKLKDRMQRTGDAMIGFQPIDSMNLPNFFRLVLPNPRHLSREDLRDMMARMVGCRTWCHHADRIGATDHMRKVHRWYYSFSLRCTLGMIRLR